LFLNELRQKAKIEYPYRWVYKVIGTDKDLLREIFAALLQDDAYSVTSSHSSATGKYHCLNLEVTVEGEEKRVAIYETLRSHPSIKYVL
jgi:uncharacterized protein